VVGLPATTSDDNALRDERGGRDPGLEEELQRGADALNRIGDGDSAGFVLRYFGGCPTACGLRGAGPPPVPPSALPIGLDLAVVVESRRLR
jgi:hypothetical protein